MLSTAPNVAMAKLRVKPKRRPTRPIKMPSGNAENALAEVSMVRGQASARLSLPQIWAPRIANKVKMAICEPTTML
ncbi:MAG UNVERIFIED_CONTAM: hypothetical protein LVT10_09100 [Anaerolineae bacterium]|jgi:hypothetical protein